VSCKNLEIWQLARELVIDVHEMTLNKLPWFEMFRPVRLDFSNCGYGTYPVRGGLFSKGRKTLSHNMGPAAACMGPCLLRSCNPTKGTFHVVMEYFVASFGKEAPTDKV